MLLRSFFVSLSLLVVHIACIFVPFRQIALPAYIVMFSLLYFPLICGLFKNKLSYGFGKHYFHFVKIGFTFCILSALSGIILILPFTILFRYQHPIIRILSGIAGGTGITIWFFLITRWICLPRFADLTLLKAFSASSALAKKSHTTLFLVIIRTYFLCLLIIPAPWAIKNYVMDIKNLPIREEIKSLNRIT